MSNIFASLTLLRPHKLRKTKGEEEKKSEVVTKQEQQAGLKDRIKNMLESEELIPRVRYCLSSPFPPFLLFLFFTFLPSLLRD